MRRDAIMRRNDGGLARSPMAIAWSTLAALVGIAIGIGSFTFLYADGSAYLSNDPKACANCHIMRANHDAWSKSSHHEVATCNDCHAPHDSIVAKLWVKGENGFRHSLAFTTGRFHEPIRIRAKNRAVTEAACRSCHQLMVQAINPQPGAGEAIECIRCHADVGHP